MPKFIVNHRTGQPEVWRPEPPTQEEVLAKTKRVHHREIALLKLKDEDIKSIITSVATGTRNIEFLCARHTQRTMYRSICAYILREMQQ
ncbi:hypothetical protein [Ralstonia phage RP13]|nr:hypothetical protein [Ralstonia phage RP13]